MVLQYHLWCRIGGLAGWHSVMANKIAVKFVAQIGLVVGQTPTHYLIPGFESARLGELMM
jgi:hypothetical protein